MKYLVVDMTPVTRSDSSGAHFIYDLARDLKKDRNIQLVLCNPTDTVSNSITMDCYTFFQQLLYIAGLGC